MEEPTLKTSSCRSDHRALRHGLYRAHDARLDDRSHDRAIHPHRAAEGRQLSNIVLKHALRNALIAPFTVIMLQIPVAAERRRDRRDLC